MGVLDVLRGACTFQPQRGGGFVLPLSSSVIVNSPIFIDYQPFYPLQMACQSMGDACVNTGTRTGWVIYGLDRPFLF